jgi:predicted nicotinamide N-methyase
MTALSKLTLITATKPNTLAPIVQKRNKLLKKLHEQIELATALAEGRHYTATKLRNVTDDAGNTKIVEMAKQVRQWWWTADNGKLCLTVRYGAKLLELAKGKTAIELASAEELVTVLETVKAAVAAGELDAAITATSGAVRSSFKQ